MRIFAAFAIVAVSAALCAANPPRAAQQVVPVQQFVPVQPIIQVPAYGAGYNAAPDASDIKALLEEQRKTNALLRQLLQGKPPEELPPPKQGAGPKKLDITAFMNACARCHDSSIAEKKGDGVVLTEKGSILPLSSDMTRAISLELSSGRMPKGSRLTDDEYADIFLILDSVWGGKLGRKPKQ
jgi:hypothetical protein